MAYYTLKNNNTHKICKLRSIKPCDFVTVYRHHTGFDSHSVLCVHNVEFILYTYESCDIFIIVTDQTQS